MIIRIAETPSELNQAYQVRMDVFVKEQHVPVELEMDEHDKEAIHFVGYVDNTPVAASRLRFVDTYGKLERICVRAEQRGQSFGKQIILRMEEQLKENGYSTAKLNAQTHALEFYHRLGYEVISEEFMDAGIPHVTMVKQLK
ncbi:GNAT family N-acetyltransferase [Ornithinibacillus gellani]|uniref:GNAT family N-acetyltransferase n=1 Tax=Ornithinibacillus gellani TaxID=2293253 RepID=UPI000F4A529F|nr:GNAT family N-acetyltransferase [Ornithinibacillus gellani]TQS75792.1 GNAT family N-acetyltransferase [Ornithinibacillus gellani]